MATADIGPGKTHTTISAWEATLSGTLTEDEIGQCYITEFNEGVAFAGFTASSGAKCILRAAAGQSFNDHASKLTNALRYNTANGVAWKHSPFFAPTCGPQTAFVEIEGIQIKTAGGTSPHAAVQITANDVRVDKCILCTDVSVTRGILTFRSGVVRGVVANSLIQGKFDGAIDHVRSEGTTWDLESCTLVTPTDHTGGAQTNLHQMTSGTLTVRNCLLFNNGGTTKTVGAGSITGSFNGGEDTEANLPGGTGANNQGLLTDTAELENANDATLDARTKRAGGADNNGSVTALSNGEDIVERPRAATTAIGCWEPAAAMAYRHPARRQPLIAH